MAKRGRGTTQPGFRNDNQQLVIRDTGLPGTLRGQRIYVLECHHCCHRYGANGPDIHERLCPACQGGAPAAISVQTSCGKTSGRRRSVMASKITPWNVAVAAEAVAAAQFARCGCDVSVQYGADQPEYDLIVAKGDRMMKVSVKGSQDGGWGLTQSYLKDADYHGAIERWVLRHGARTVLCFVQFHGVELNELPRVYVATPAEVADRLRTTAKNRGDTILYEEHTWTARAIGAGTVERIPQAWRFSAERVQQLLEGPDPSPVAQ